MLALLVLLAAAGAIWTPLLLVVPFLAMALGALLLDASLGARRARFPARTRGTIGLRLLTALLYLLQPPVRLAGRLAAGLVPWRARGPSGLRLALPGTVKIWHEDWATPEARVHELIGELRGLGAVAVSGGAWDRWDVEIRGGALGSARIRVAVEEHGSGRQLLRVRCWPWPAAAGTLLLALSCVTVVVGGVLLGDLAVLLLAAVAMLRVGYECSRALRAARLALSEPVLRDEQALELATETGQ
jgi:hypothetical protein